eukprot:8841362-Heterocapsa_arctica.AAC.1
MLTSRKCAGIEEGSKEGAAGEDPGRSRRGLHTPLGERGRRRQSHTLGPGGGRRGGQGSRGRRRDQGVGCGSANH